MLSVITRLVPGGGPATSRASETASAPPLALANGAYAMQVLAKHPKYLNRFYKDESQFTLTWRNHGVPDTRETVSTTQVSPAYRTMLAAPQHPRVLGFSSC